MTITEKMQEVVSAAAGSPLVVPADRVINPQDVQGLERPYIVHFWRSVDPTETTSGTDNIRTYDYAVIVYEDNYSDGETLFGTLRDALPGVHDGVNVRWTGGQYGGMDDETLVHEFLLAFSVAEHL